MLKATRVILIFALGGGGFRGLGAQELAQLCGSAAHVSVGQWASYTRSGGQDDGATVRFAIVSSERRGDSTLYWLEIKHSGAANPAHNGVVQVLVPGFGAELLGIRALVLQQGDQPAMRLPDQMVSMLGQQVGQNNPTLAIAMRCASARVIGWETTIVPSGPVRALHVTDSDGNEAWRVPDVPFGFVKVRMQSGAMMMLTGHGAGARSSLVGMP
jgi:hypothetical protein